MNDAHWMRLAQAQAEVARAHGEVPVGAVVVKDGVVIGSGRNAPVGRNDPTAHAEVMALREAAQALGNYRLEGCALYVTLEPCAMCAGAILHARLDRLVYGAPDSRTGAAGSVLDLFAQGALNHHTTVTGGVLADDCAQPLQDFFRTRRSQHRAQAQPLRDDALRTPNERFAAFAPDALPFVELSDLPSLAGLRLHCIDTGPAQQTRAVVCLHGWGQWGHVHRHTVAALRARPGLRVLVPDLIGFGRSDKPKRESLHVLAWHVAVLRECFDRLGLKQVVLVATEAAHDLARALAAADPRRVAALVVAATRATPSLEAAAQAPFPDRGHEAALRVWGSAARLHDVDPASAAEAAAQAMGYFPP